MSCTLTTVNLLLPHPVLLEGRPAGTTVLKTKTATSREDEAVLLPVPGILHIEMGSLQNFILGTLWTAKSRNS